MRSAGEVRVLGEDPARAGEDWRARTGVVLQSWRDHPRWTPRRLLSQLGGYYAPYSTPEVERPVAVDDAARDGRPGPSSPIRRSSRSRAGSAGASTWRSGSSGGRSCCSSTSRPPASTRDARREFHHLVHRLSDLEGTTILLTTHDLDEAEKLADRILILADGTIVAAGSADQLARQVARDAEVRWSRDGEAFVHSTADATHVRPRPAQPARRRGHATSRSAGRAWRTSTSTSCTRTSGPSRRRSGEPDAQRDPARPPARLDGVRAEPPQPAGPGLLPLHRADGAGLSVDPPRRPASRAPTCSSRRSRCRASSAAWSPSGSSSGRPTRSRWSARTGRCCATRRCPHGLRGYFTGQLAPPQPRHRAAAARDPRPELPALRRPHGRRRERLADRRLGAGPRDARDDAARDDHRGARAQHAEGGDLGHAADPRPDRHLRDLLSRSSSCGAGCRWSRRSSRRTGSGSACARRSSPTRPPRSRSATAGGRRRRRSCSAAWAIVGMIVTPIVLRRMARRQSGSQMEAARETAAQWVR